MIRLLPPVCRDCGRSAEDVALSPYLDFQLCSACIARREREVRAVDAPGRRGAPTPEKPQPESRPASPRKKPPAGKSGARSKRKPPNH